MELRDLEYFLAVAREGSLTGAAKVLHLSQPGITRSLKALEEELGKQLIIRGNRGVSLTEEGMKTATLQPYPQNITLTCGEVYTLQITGSKGVSASRALVVQDVNPLIVYI